ncbi:MAG TPA: hypothetical protein DEF43_07930 [Chloroflexus aurantiacus]|nr:MAG: hypothetical protein D6716_08860 [Chloroflexota bacterium]HBW67078.1 hypothetical protein [Chloroflexus aurantiacus]
MWLGDRSPPHTIFVSAEPVLAGVTTRSERSGRQPHSTGAHLATFAALSDYKSLQNSRMIVPGSQHSRQGDQIVALAAVLRNERFA